MFYTKVGKKNNEGKRQVRLSAAILAAVITLAMGVAAPVCRADDDDNEIPFAEANIFFELNNTDGDLGIHALIDGEPWKSLEIEDPNEREMLDINVEGRLRRQGLTEIFFESAEPTFDELSPRRFFRRFKEGEYEIEGETLDGAELESVAILTHLLPAPADNVVINEVPIESGCPVDEAGEDDPPVVGAVGDAVVISWDRVRRSHPDLGRTNEPIEDVMYQIVVEWENDDEVVFVFSNYLPPSGDRMSITVPPEFIALGDEFKFEILLREESGNQTAIERCFALEEAD
jgi:hypothetical protein